MIPFNVPTVTGAEQEYVLEAISSGKMSGGGNFSRKCEEWFQKTLHISRSLFTPSCTHALEMSAILIDIKEGDEVIMPSFTFVSTANAFVLRGAKIVFVDVRPDTMNIDETLIQAAITEKTKAIVVVHYAGVACEMDAIMQEAKENNLYVIEDAAQAVGAYYKGKPLGSIGDSAAFSFHETKNYNSGGEGGLLVLRDSRFVQRAEIIREKGTNRSLFLRGVIDKYSWVDIGSSYLPSELQAGFLWGQLQKIDLIASSRLRSWNLYQEKLQPLVKAGLIEIPNPPKHCSHNGHVFFVKAKNIEERDALTTHLGESGIQAAFHYVPLHTSTAGRVYGRLSGEDRYTTRESERLLRLPIWYGIDAGSVDRVCRKLSEFYNNASI